LGKGAHRYLFLANRLKATVRGLLWDNRRECYFFHYSL
jgi:hypothetical protein